MISGLKKASTPYGEFWVHTDESVGLTLLAGGFWDAEFLRPEFDKVQAGELVVDVGAFIGWFSIYAAKRGCRVHAFEPSPDNYEILLENIKMNGVQDLIITHDVPLFSSDVAMKIHASRNMSSGWAVVPAPLANHWQLCSDSFSGPTHHMQVAGLCVYLDQLDILQVEAIQRTRPTIALWYEVESSGLHLHNESLQDYHNFIEEIGYIETALMGESDFVARPKEYANG